MKVDSTVEAIEQMATNAEATARELRSIAQRMRDKEDLNYSVEATSAVVNMVSNMRLDLLVARPIRQLERTLAQLKKDG